MFSTACTIPLFIMDAVRPMAEKTSTGPTMITLR